MARLPVMLGEPAEEMRATGTAGMAVERARGAQRSAPQSGRERLRDGATGCEDNRDGEKAAVPLDKVGTRRSNRHQYLPCELRAYLQALVRVTSPLRTMLRPCQLACFG